MDKLSKKQIIGLMFLVEPTIGYLISWALTSDISRDAGAAAMGALLLVSFTTPVLIASIKKQWL